MVKLTIDGKAVTVPKDYSILQAARSAGIRIPTLCIHERMKPIGYCGLCVVENAGNETPLLSCETLVAEGMSITTNSDRLLRIRQEVLKTMLAGHPLDCPVCDKAGECLLQDLVYEHGIVEVEAQPPISQFTTSYTTTFIKSWPQRCVLCRRCVTACNEIQGIGALEVIEGPEGERISYDRDKCVSVASAFRSVP